jgi:hypothetical protein
LLQRVDAQTPADPAALQRPGGFAWWYLDLVDDNGDGLVLIWAWGLPFLPGLARDARRGQPSLPRDRPAISFALYEGGRCTCYLLQEAPAAAASTDLLGDFCVGGATLCIRPLATPESEGEGEAEGAGEGFSLRATLDLPIPGSAGRLRGEVRAAGPALRGGSLGPRYAGHSWSPRLAGAEGEAQLDVAGRAVALRGRLYHDRNEGTAPMHAHGIADWWWGRLALADRALIWYRLRHEDGHVEEHLLDVDHSGQARDCAAPAALSAPSRWAWFGPRCPRQLTLTDADGRAHPVALEAPIDDSPFYQRLRMRCPGGWGWAERVIPAAIDPDWMRPLVRMRVQQLDGPNSLWLPLFAGPVETRLRRLLRPAPPALVAR